MTTPHKRKRRKSRRTTSKQTHTRKQINEKEAHINDLLAEESIDLELLRRYATSKYGLINNEIRAQVWPKLLGVNPFTKGVQIDQLAEEIHYEEMTHSQVQQIERDVDRSMFHFDVCMTYTDNQRASKRRDLSVLLNAVLLRNPRLHYYQGYHDVVSVFLLVVGPFRTLPLIERYSRSFLNDHHMPNFDQTMELLRLYFPLLQLADKEVYDFMVSSEVAPFFALPWVITGFSHHFSDLDVMARLYDVFLASHPLLPLYMSVAVALVEPVRSHLLCQPRDLPSVHSFMQQIPQAYTLTSTARSNKKHSATSVPRRSEGEFAPKKFNIEHLVSKALALLEELPPPRLVKHVKTFNRSLGRHESELRVDLSKIVRPDGIAVATFPFPWMKAKGCSDDSLRLRKRKSKQDRNEDALSDPASGGNKRSGITGRLLSGGTILTVATVLVTAMYSYHNHGMGRMNIDL